MFCAFIDFEKAFDKVWRDGLWYKLLLNNMNGSTVSSAYKITKSFRYIPSWVSISLEIVCNPFKLQFVKLKLWFFPEVNSQGISIFH
jgi:hypothetical protein